MSCSEILLTGKVIEILKSHKLFVSAMMKKKIDNFFIEKKWLKILTYKCKKVKCLFKKCIVFYLSKKIVKH